MDASEIRRTNNAVWNTMATGWDERHAYLEQTARPVTEAMLDEISPRPGETILDLAAGTGLVGLAATERVRPGGHVIIGDFAESMVDVARRYAAEMGVENVDCRVLDAEQLDLDDESVDAVLCRWGYMLMPDPAAALSETHRVLRPGGRLCCAVFAGPDDNPWAALPMRALLELDLVEPPPPGAPGILALADHERLRQLLTGAGFGDVRLTTMPFSFRLEDIDDYWDFLRGSAGAIALVLERLGDEDRTAARLRLEDVVEPFSTDDGILLPATAVIASAARPV